MYSYIRASGILKESSGIPQSIDLTTVRLKTLYTQYSQVVIVLTHPAVPAVELALKLTDLPNTLQFTDYLLEEWLAVIGNQSLPTTVLNEIPVQQVFVTFTNLWQNDFQAELSNINFHPAHSLFPEEQIDVRLTRSGAQYDRLQRNGLVTVNGLIHKTEANAHGLYALDGGRSRKLSNLPSLGYLDFSKVAKLTTIPITDQMIYARTEGRPLKEILYINVGQSMQNKTALLVVAGHLHALDETYSVVGDSALRFDFSNYNFFKRFIKTKQFLNLESLGNLELVDGGYDQELLYSDATIRKWFTLSQSFIILLDRADITVGHEELADPLLTGRYYSRIAPKLPLTVDGNFLTEYKATKEHNGWVISPVKYLTDVLAIEETQYLGNRGLAYRRRSDAPVKRTTAKWLRLGRVKET